MDSWAAASSSLNTFSGQSRTVVPRRCGWWKPPPKYACSDGGYGLHARQVTKVTLSTGGFSGFVASTAAPITSGRNESVPGRDFHPQWTSAFSRRTRDQFDRKFTIKGETKFTTKKQRLYGNSTG